MKFVTAKHPDCQSMIRVSFDPRDQNRVFKLLLDNGYAIIRMDWDSNYPG